jgi:signal transduction histidine kinase
VSSRPAVVNVDDNAAGRYARTRVLEDAGFRVIEAATGAEALNVAASHPDLMLLDVNLPDMSGFEVCRRIRQESSTSRLPVVHVSASVVAPSDRARALEGGADAYLVEPIEPLELIAVVKAVLRARRAEEDAIQARSEAEEALAERDRFIAVAAHELKGPLTALRGRVQLAQSAVRRGPSHRASTQLDHAIAAVDRLTELVDQLWDRSAFSAEQTTTSEPVDLVPLVRSVAASLEPLAAARGCDLHLELPELAAVAIRPAHFERVVRNLLTNAINYGRGAPVRVRLVLQGDRIRLSVTDNGPGIPEIQRERVFSPYVRLDNGGSGLGLGLAIVKDIVSAAGGRIDLASEPGRGSTFGVELRRAGVRR